MVGVARSSAPATTAEHETEQREPEQHRRCVLAARIAAASVFWDRPARSLPARIDALEAHRARRRITHRALQAAVRLVVAHRARARFAVRAGRARGTDAGRGERLHDALLEEAHATFGAVGVRRALE